MAIKLQNSPRYSGATGLAPGSKVPRVSICLPNLNTRRYLQERLDTIFEQTLADWELIICDNYSDDGAWAFLQEQTNDPRVRLFQAPREGMYANWNNCIGEARGDYVYIATSDDTMAPDCLEKMVAALDLHPTCGLAHCNLKMIDENGALVSSDWWSQASLFALSSGQLLTFSHIRRAPFDGLLHLLGDTVYTSITQLLIRRSLFSKIGLFKSHWRSMGDFNWNMRASLVADAIHVPNTWGGWRRHSDQATAAANLGSAAYRAAIEEMIADAIASSEVFLTGEIRKLLKSRWAARTCDLRAFLPEINARTDALERRAFLTGRLLVGSWAARQHLVSRICRPDDLLETAPKIIRNWLERAGIEPVLVST